MKFKSVFWFFNLIMISLLLFIFFLNWRIRQIQKNYLSQSHLIFIFLISLAIIAWLEYFFISRWKMFIYLEEENWPVLLLWLEDKVYVKKDLLYSCASLLINTALITSNMDAINRLLVVVQSSKPAMMRRLGVSLGIPLMLEQDTNAIIKYFTPLADDPRTHWRFWARWCKAFADKDQGINEMFGLLKEKDASVSLLAMDFLQRNLLFLNESQRNMLEEVRKKMIVNFSGYQGMAVIKRSQSQHVMAVVFSQSVNNARKRLLEVRS